MPKTRKSGFTLVELLVVMAIIGLMLALGIPVVTSLMKSGGLSAASREVSNTLTLARQYAITQRTNVRVVFPYFGTTGTGTYQAPPYQSYAAVFSNRDTQSWQYIGKWEFLPLGTVFMNENPILGTNTPTTLPCLDNLGTATSFPFPNNIVGNNATLAYIEFTPTGAASANGGGIFTITEGLINGGVPVPTSKGKNGSILANMVTVSVDSVVGHIRVSRP